MSSSPDFAEIYRNFGAQNNEFLKVCSFAAVCLRNSSADYAPGLEAEAMMSLVDGEGEGGGGLMMKTSSGAFAEKQGCFSSPGPDRAVPRSRRCTRKAEFFLAPPKLLIRL